MVPGITAKNSKEIPRSPNFAPFLPPPPPQGKACPCPTGAGPAPCAGVVRGGKEERARSRGGESGKPPARGCSSIAVGRFPPTAPAAPGAPPALQVGKLRHGHTVLHHRAAPPWSPSARPGVTQQSHMED